MVTEETRLSSRMNDMSFKFVGKVESLLLSPGWNNDAPFSAGKIDGVRRVKLNAVYQRTIERLCPSDHIALL